MTRKFALTPVIDCSGFYDASCGPAATTKWVQRTTWG